MNYVQTIDYLYNTLPMFSRMGSVAFKKDLDNILVLCEALDNPQNKFKSIHVAGTNGKGSVSHMLAAILQTSGFKTGLYTSPHLYDFRERIRVNGQMVDKKYVVEFVERIQPLIEKIHPSFFEITVAMAFEYFAKQRTDIAIIEVGLGGRLDSTNIITPELSIITNIGWDHMNLLGNTLEEIAMEKAGIIKQSVPVVIGERQKGLDQLLSNIAGEKECPVYFASDEYEATGYQWKDPYLEIEVLSKKENETFKWETDLQGIYQGKNICTVLKAREILSLLPAPQFSISGEDLNYALKNVKKLTGLQGRWEVIHHHPTVVLEVAHNVDGIKQMLLHFEKLHFEKLHIVLGMVKDKEIDAVLNLLPAGAQYYFTQANIPRAMDASHLKEKAAAYSLNGDVFKNADAALYSAVSAALPEDLVIVCGSIFLVAEVNRNSISQLA